MREPYLENKDYILINVREYAMDKANEWFRKNYEEKFTYSQLYTITNPDCDRELQTYGLKDECNTIFFDKVDEIEEELLHYKRV